MGRKEMTVFISWSQPASHEIAEVLKSELTSLFKQQIEFWVSSKDIATGSISIQSIIAALQRSSMAIICLDSSNYRKPWIYYETGVVFGKNYSGGNKNQPVIIPIMFDNLKVSDFQNTPFSNMQLMPFTKATMENAVNQINTIYYREMNQLILNEETLTRSFDKIWTRLYDKIDSIIKQKKVGSDMRLTEENVAELLTKYDGFPPPTYGNVIRYSSGFETANFYKFLLENVTSRLYVFGRKNRKLSESTPTAYSTLKSKNVDLKILFLNPNSEQAKSDKTQDVSDFRTRLILSIKDFCRKYEDLGLNISEDCRMYSEQRDSEVIVADDIVLYKDLSYTPAGKPMHFTNTSFFITSISSQIGTTYYNQFISVWDKNEKNKISESFVRALSL